MRNFRHFSPTQSHAPFCLMRALVWIPGLSLTFLWGFIVPVIANEETPQVVDQVAIHHYEPENSYGYTLPVYEVGSIRFLSGGIGVEEREATYPPYSLKLILAQHPHAFLAHVSLFIKDEKGQTVVNIPHDLVTGPWVFIDLPPGRYHIVGESRNGRRIERTIGVKTGSSTVHHLIWPQE